MAIVTLPTFKSYIRDEGNGLDDSILQGYIDAASQGLSNACARQWVVASGPATARLFQPSNSDVLFINDCTTITSVVASSASLVAGTDYRAEPLNNLSAAGETVPFYRLRRATSWGGYGYGWGTTSLATITVTATWGWAAIPYQIVEACLVLGKELCNNQDVRLGIVGLADGVVSGIRQSKVVRDAIYAYPHPNSIGVA